MNILNNLQFFQFRLMLIVARLPLKFFCSDLDCIDVRSNYRVLIILKELINTMHSRPHFTVALNQWQNIVFSFETNFGQSYQTIINPIRPGGGGIPPLLCFFANNCPTKTSTHPGDFRFWESPQTFPFLSIGPFEHAERFQNLKFAVKRITNIQSAVLSSSEGASAVHLAFK